MKRYPSSYSKDPLVSEEDLREAAAEVAAVVDAKTVALAGGVAMSVYGPTLLTSDIDILAEEPLRARGFTKRGGGSLSFGGQRLTTPSGVPLDVIVRTDQYADLYEEALTAAVGKRKPAGWPIHVVPLEYLITMKLQASRDKDIRAIEQSVRFDAFNEKKTKDVIEKFLGSFAVEEFDRISEYALWKHESGRGDDD